MILQEMADHEDAAVLLGAGAQRLGIAQMKGQRFLDEDMLAGGESLGNQSTMRLRRCGDGYGWDLRGLPERRQIHRGNPERRGHLAGGLRPRVADGGKST